MIDILSGNQLNLMKVITNVLPWQGRPGIGSKVLVEPRVLVKLHLSSVRARDNPQIGVKFCFTTIELIKIVLEVSIFQFKLRRNQLGSPPKH